jgi:hypothetical protein
MSVIGVKGANIFFIRLLGPDNPEMGKKIRRMKEM